MNVHGSHNPVEVLLFRVLERIMLFYLLPVSKLLSIRNSQFCQVTKTKKSATSHFLLLCRCCPTAYILLNRIFDKLNLHSPEMFVTLLFLSFRRALNVICSFLGNSPSSEF